MAKKLRFNEAGRWQDKPYDPQFEVDAGETVEVTGRHVVVDGICESVTHDFAAMVEEAGRGEVLTVKDSAPVKKAEGSQARKKAEGSQAK